MFKRLNLFKNHPWIRAVTIAVLALLLSAEIYFYRSQLSQFFKWPTLAFFIIIVLLTIAWYKFPFFRKILGEDKTKKRSKIHWTILIFLTIIFIVPISIYNIQLLSIKSSLPLFIAIGFIFTILSFVLTAIRQISADSRRQFWGVGQKFALAVIAYFIFIPLLNLLNQTPFNNIDIYSSPNLSDSTAWVRGIMFYSAATLFYCGEFLFMFGITDLVRSLAEVNIIIREKDINYSVNSKITDQSPITLSSKELNQRKEFDGLSAKESQMARNATQKFNIQSVGEVELSRILRKHFKTIIKSVSLEPREFTVFVINNLLIKPKLNITEIQSLPDATLEQIALQILGKEEYLKKYFSEAKGESVFDRFLQAFKDQQREQVNLYLKMIAPFLGQTQNTEAMFSLGYTLPSSVRYIKKTKQVEFIEESSGQLSVLLNEIDPDLELKRRGAWQTFRGESNDRISQAAHSMREVIRLLLDCLAPEEKILHAPWYQKPRVKPDVTRKMKVRFAIGGASSEISDSTVDFVDSLANAADEAYYKLSAEAHTSGKGYKQAEAFLKAGEAVILLILTNRFQNSA